MAGDQHGRANERRRGRAAEAVLDTVDKKILSALAADARMPNNTLASLAGVAPSTCLARVRRLEATGVIRGYKAELAAEALGRSIQAIVAVRMQAHARANIGGFARRFAELPGVLNVFFLAGVNDFQIHVAAASPDELREFVVTNLSASNDIAVTETSLVFEHVSGSGLTPVGQPGRLHLDRRA